MDADTGLGTGYPSIVKLHRSRHHAFHMQAGDTERARFGTAGAPASQMLFKACNNRRLLQQLFWQEIAERAQVFSKDTNKGSVSLRPDSIKILLECMSTHSATLNEREHL